MKKEFLATSWNVTILRQSLLKDGSVQLPLCEACLKILLVEMDFFVKRKKSNEVDALLKILVQLMVVMIT